MKTRQNLLQCLIEFREPIQPLLETLAKEPWDVEEPLVILDTATIKAVLVRYLNSEISSDDVEEWANAVECRDDIEIEHSHENTIRDVLSILANPTLNLPLTMEYARELVNRLDKE